MISWQDQALLVYTRLGGLFAQISRSLRLLHSLVLDKVSLLLHVVGDIDLWEKDFFSASNGNLLISFLLTNLGHLLSGTIVLLLFLDDVVSLSLLEKSLLLDATGTIRNNF